MNYVKQLSLAAVMLGVLAMPSFLMGVQDETTAEDVQGYTVTGKIEVPQNNAGITPQLQHSRIVLTQRVQAPRMPVPENYARMTREERLAWQKEWRQTDEYKEYIAQVQKIRANLKRYDVTPDKDGSFTIEDVKPGTYVLQGSAFSSEEAMNKKEVSAVVQGSVVVADKDVAFDNIKVKVFNRVEVGDQAPDFTVKTLDGEDLKLSDLKGKYVMLDFWATWCGPCIAELPNMRDTFKSYGDNPNFVILSISYDRDMQTPAKYVQENDMPWMHTFAEGGFDSEAGNAYGVRGIPSLWLIGPDGTVVAKGFRGKAIKATVAKHLEQVSQK